MKRRTKLGCGVAVGAAALALLGLGVREVLVRLSPGASRAGLSAPEAAKNIPWDERAVEKLVRAERQLRDAKTLSARVRHARERRGGASPMQRILRCELRLGRPNLYRITSRFPDLTTRIAPHGKPTRDFEAFDIEACDGWFAWLVEGADPEESATFSVGLVDGSEPRLTGLYPLSGFWPPAEGNWRAEYAPLIQLRNYARAGQLARLALEKDGSVFWEAISGGRRRFWFDARGNYRKVVLEGNTEEPEARPAGERRETWIVENLTLDAPMTRESFSCAPPENAVPDPNYASTKWALPFTGLPGRARGWGLPF